MARVSAQRVEETKRDLLEAAREVLTTEGYTGLSTRRVAEAAGTRMSQIQYHFGSKEGMILALFDYMNAKLLARQTSLFDDPDASISRKWALACDYLDEDLASGYVRVLQELIAAGWSNPAINDAVRAALGQWHMVLCQLGRDAEAAFGTLGPLSVEDLAALVGAAFVGAEAMILLGYEDKIHPIRGSLRRVGAVIATLENRSPLSRTE